MTNNMLHCLKVNDIGLQFNGELFSKLRAFLAEQRRRRKANDG